MATSASIELPAGHYKAPHQVHTPSPGNSLESGNSRSRNSMDDMKRANHNALERKRRIYQKEKLQELRQAVPELRDSKPSTVDILLKSTDYIAHLRQRHDAYERHIQSMRELNRSLREKLNLCAEGNETLIPRELLDASDGVYAPESSAAVAKTLVLARSVSVEPEVAMHRTRTDSMSDSAFSADRKRPSREEDAIPPRQRKISRSESTTGYDSDAIPDEVFLLQNFCEMAQRHSISWEPGERTESISEEPNGHHEEGVFEMEDAAHADAGAENGDARVLRHRSKAKPVGEDRRTTPAKQKRKANAVAPAADDDESSSASLEVDVIADSGVASKESARSPDTESGAEDGEEITCFCGQGWSGKFMIMCDKCNRWLHGECVGIQPRRTPKTFICEDCRKRR